VLERSEGEVLEGEPQCATPERLLSDVIEACRHSHRLAGSTTSEVRRWHHDGRGPRISSHTPETRKEKPPEKARATKFCKSSFYTGMCLKRRARSFDGFCFHPQYEVMSFLTSSSSLLFFFLFGNCHHHDDRKGEFSLAFRRYIPINGKKAKNLLFSQSMLVQRSSFRIPCLI
jgi:hypothetical protein